jgi:hypothetical protein
VTEWRHICGWTPHKALAEVKRVERADKAKDKAKAKVKPVAKIKKTSRYGYLKARRKRAKLGREPTAPK